MTTKVPSGWASAMATLPSGIISAPPACPKTGACSVLVATVNFPFVATENRTL